MMDTISNTPPVVNKVAASGIQVLDLADMSPAEVQVIDLEQFLFGGLILKEKHFRQEVRDHDWEVYRGAHIGIICSVDTIVPVWAYMLLGSTLDGIAAFVTVGDEGAVRREAFLRALGSYDWSAHQDRIVVVKGCGTSAVPESAFVHCVTQLQRVASKIMFGEPCSSVPLWRRPKNKA